MAGLIERIGEADIREAPPPRPLYAIVQCGARPGRVDTASSMEDVVFRLRVSAPRADRPPASYQVWRGGRLVATAVAGGGAVVLMFADF